MIFHRLVWRFIRHGDDAGFYRIQAEDCVRWLEENGVPLGAGVRALDLGCGLGVIGAMLSDKGCEVVFADELDSLLPGYSDVDFREVDIESDALYDLGTFDLVVCSNVLEHLRDWRGFLSGAHRLLAPGGYLYLSWTNWLSPWGGHEFSPFHYLGPRLGPAVYDRLVGKPRDKRPYENLFPTYVGKVLDSIRYDPDMKLLRAVPRYYPELPCITRIPLIREFLTFNPAVLAVRTGAA